jgi:cyclomaltodextrinase / maltogenic alpha-amylase / neopullulanase
MRQLKAILSIISTVLLVPVIAGAQGHEDWSYNLGIYEVNIRQYSPEGTFSAFGEHLDRLQDMGVGIIWLMPVHPIGNQNRLGSLGSYYSVKDYYGINPEFGTLSDFRELIDEIHNRGMYVLMDWVANHTSWDNQLTIDHPEWYITNNNGEFIPPPGTNWSDVIQLDFTQQDLRDYMIDAMTYWVEEFGVDGFRYDAAGFVPMDFWEEAIIALRELKPDIFLLAEDNGPEWHETGFDMTFGWDLYGFGHGVLSQIVDGSYNASHLHAYTADQLSEYPPDAYRMYFTSNHDENSWYGTTGERFGDAAEVFSVLVSTFHGMPLIYSGQEAGLSKRLQFFDKDLIPWQDHSNAGLYKILLNLKRQNRALWNGDNGGELQRIHSTHNSSVYAYLREKDEDRVFVALNLTADEKSITLYGSAYTGEYRDVFSDEIVYLEESETLSLPGWSYLVFEGTSPDVSLIYDNNPLAFTLSQNYPNPFNPSTNIQFTLPESGMVTVEILDISGRLVSVLVDEMKNAGNHQVQWDASGMSSGIYIYRIRSGYMMRVRKMVLIR